MNYFVIKNTSINRFEFLETSWDLEEVNKISHWTVVKTFETKALAKDECNALNS